MYLFFHSDSSREFRGFHLTYHTIVSSFLIVFLLRYWQCYKIKWNEAKGYPTKIASKLKYNETPGFFFKWILYLLNCNKRLAKLPLSSFFYQTPCAFEMFFAVTWPFKDYLFIYLVLLHVLEVEWKKYFHTSWRHNFWFWAVASRWRNRQSGWERVASVCIWFCNSYVLYNWICSSNSTLSKYKVCEFLNKKST